MSTPSGPLIDISVPPPAPNAPGGATYDPNTNTFKVSVPAPALSDADPHQTALLQAEGWKDSGWIERLAIAFWTAIVTVAGPVITQAFAFLDQLMAMLGQFMLDAQAKNTPQFWNFVGELITDLLGVKVDGQQLFTDLQTGGTLSVMRATGAALINTLIGEFTGTATGTGGQISGGTTGAGIGGLPAVTLTPAGGLDAARTFMGFVLSFAVREGNTDMFADLVPLGLGHGFKDFAEAMAKNLGLGRMSRLALRPLFQELISTPLTWALKSQYRTALLNPQEAIKAGDDGVFTSADVDNELALHGYSDTRIAALKSGRARPLPEHVLFELNAYGQIDDPTLIKQLQAHGYTQPDAAQLVFYYRHQESRREARQAYHLALSKLLAGDASISDVQSVINTFDFTADEKTLLQALASQLDVIPRRQATFGQWEKALANGSANIGDVQDFLNRAGYRPQDQPMLLSTALLAIKGAKHKHATIAQWIKAVKAGTETLANYQAFLQSQGYAQEDQTILLSLA